MKTLALALAVAVTAITAPAITATTPAAAAPLCEGSKLGLAGLLARCNRGEPITITLASGQPLFAGEQPVKIQSGAYYELHIEADGSAELAITGPQFFRSIWMNEIVINDIEVRPMAIDSIEFDAAGKARLSFIAIRPGSYDVYIPNSRGDSQKVTFLIQ